MGNKSYWYLLFIFLGAYVPLTMEGNIIVDGILASCYPSADHDMAHFGMAPIRLFPDIIKKVFGEGNGVQAYVNIANELGKYLLPYNSIY